MINPFNLIVPREDELMINESSIKELSDKIKERIKDRRLIVLEGDYGTGKSLYFKRLYQRLKTRKELINFTDVIISVLESKVPVKNKTIFIDNFDLVHGFNDEQINRLIKAMNQLINEGVIILIACRKDTLKKLYSINPLIRSRVNRVKIPKLTFDEAKELVIARLNESRKIKSDSLEPFTIKELRSIWRTSDNNPRMLLLLLAPLYEQRMMLKA